MRRSAGKAEFVRSMPDSTPPKLVVAAARKQGLSIALGYVYEVRGPGSVRPDRQPRSGGRKGGPGMPGHVSAKTAFLHTLIGGPGTEAELLLRVRRKTGGAIKFNNPGDALQELEKLGYVRRLKQKRVRVGIGGPPPYRYGITGAGRRVAKTHRAVILGLQVGRGDRPSAKPRRGEREGGPGLPGHLSAKTAFLHALMAGRGTVAELLAHVRHTTGGAVLFDNRVAAHALCDLERLGYARGYKRKHPRPSSTPGTAGRWPYGYAITRAGRRVARNHRAAILGLHRAGGGPRGTKRRSSSTARPRARRT